MMFVVLHTTENDSATQEEQQQIEKVLDATAVDTGESSAKSQGLFVESPKTKKSRPVKSSNHHNCQIEISFCIGVHHLLRDHPSLLQEATADFSPVTCTKNTGETKRLRWWSRGHQLIVRAGGHIEAWQPLYMYVNIAY